MGGTGLVGYMAHNESNHNEAHFNTDRQPDRQSDTDHHTRTHTYLPHITNTMTATIKIMTSVQRHMTPCNKRK